MSSDEKRPTNLNAIMKKRPKPQKQKQFLFLTFRLFPKHPIIYQFQSLFPLLPLTWHYSHHFTLQDEWKSEVPFFLFEIFFNIFWQCLLEFFKKNEQIRTGCCLQCMLGQDTNHHPSATSYVWLALTAKGQRDSHVSPFCLTKTAVYVLRSSVLQNKLPHVQHDWMGPYRLQWLRSIVQILAWNPCCNKFDKNANV